MSLSAFSKIFWSRQSNEPENEPPRNYLELAEAHAKEVRKLISPDCSPSPKIHQLQCEFLGDKLTQVLKYLGDDLLDLGRCSLGDARSKQCGHFFKGLSVVSKEVKTFVIDCCKDQWIQAALMMGDQVEYVCSLSSQLDFYEDVFVYSCLIEGIGMTRNRSEELDQRRVCDICIIRQKASLDREKLLSLLATLDPRECSGDQHTLGSNLLRRLRCGYSGGDAGEPRVINGIGAWEIQSKDLEPLDVLGRGASASVFRTKWMGELLAEKSFANHQQLFKNELSILIGLSHPNILSLHCYTVDSHDCSLVVKLMDYDLCHFIKKKRRKDEKTTPFDILEAVGIMLQIAEGMHYLHNNKIVHRDLKPGNVLVKLVSAEGEFGVDYVHVRVADFGLSKIKEMSRTFSTQTSNIGTTRWMAPELYTTSQSDHMNTSTSDVKLRYPFKVDIYSFGMVCYEILTGRTPFQEMSNTELRKRVLEGLRPELPEECPSILATMIKRCWEPDPSARPRFSEICEVLRYQKALLILGQQDVSRCLEVSRCSDVANAAGDSSAKSSQQGGSDNTLNILLLGETRVGMLMFINTFCNYLTFDSFESARNGELQPLIFSKFRIEGKTIRCGARDDAEGASNRERCSSCTQICRAYTFIQEGENQKIRLIDIPEIRNSDGFTCDEQTMKGIVSCLSKYKVVHAICILLDPIEVRLTPVLKYCIVQLLGHLHKDATSNIVFCFTNSSPSMFEAGGTLNLLQHVLSESPQTAAIKLDEESMYYFDSEGFRYLACEKRCLEFKTTQTNVFKSSWEHSSDEASRLIKHIASLEPHDVKSTLSLKLVRDILAGIEGPLAMIAEALQHNLEQMKRNTKEIVRLLETHGINAEIQKALIIEEEVVETVKLEKSRTICQSMNCKGRICHDPCEVHETFLGKGQAVFSEEERYYFCEKFSLRSSECKECGCSRSSHTRVGVETRKVVRRRENEDIRKAIDEAGDGILEKASMALRLLEETERSYQEGMTVVMNAAALFAGFLAENSIVVYHIATVEYLKSQIEMKKRSADGNVSEGKQQLEELKAHLRTCEQEVQSFQIRNGSGSSKTITPGDVEDELQKLCGLSKSGAAIRETMEDVKRGYRMNEGRGIHREEVICSIPAPLLDGEDV